MLKKLFVRLLYDNCVWLACPWKLPFLIEMIVHTALYENKVSLKSTLAIYVRRMWHLTLAHKYTMSV